MEILSFVKMVLGQIAQVVGVANTFDAAVGAITLPTIEILVSFCSIAIRMVHITTVNFGNGFFGTTAITSAGSNGNGSLFEYDVPSGFYALNTKTLILMDRI